MILTEADMEIKAFFPCSKILYKVIYRNYTKRYTDKTGYIKQISHLSETRKAMSESKVIHIIINQNIHNLTKALN